MNRGIRTSRDLRPGLAPLLVLAFAVLVVGWIGYQLAQWPPQPPSAAAAGAHRTSSATHSGKHAAAGGGSLVVVGDSFATGIGADRPGRTGYPQRLAACLGMRERTVGGTDAGYVAPVGNQVVGDEVGAVPRAKPAVVVFGAGLADRLPVGVDHSVSVQQLQTAATRAWAKAAKTGAKVVVLGPFWPAASTEPGIESVRDALRQAAKKHGYTFVDVTDMLTPASAGWAIAPDRTHFTQRGYDLVAHRVAAAVDHAGIAHSSC